MPPEWSASLDEDGSLQVSSEHIFELAAIVHGYSLDSVLISDTHPRPNEPAGCSAQSGAQGKPEHQKKSRGKQPQAAQATPQQLQASEERLERERQSQAAIDTTDSAEPVDAPFFFRSHAMCILLVIGIYAFYSGPLSSLWWFWYFLCMLLVLLPTYGEESYLYGEPEPEKLRRKAHVGKRFR